MAGSQTLFESKGQITDDKAELQYEVKLLASPHPLDKNKINFLPYLALKRKNTRPPIHNIIFADISGSMDSHFLEPKKQKKTFPESESRLGEIQTGLKIMIEGGPDDDTYTFIPFDSNASVYGDAKRSKEKALSIVNSLISRRTDGGTDIGNALQLLTPELVGNLPYQAFLLTDGEDNNVPEKVMKRVKENFKDVVPDLNTFAIPLKVVGIGEGYNTELVTQYADLTRTGYHHMQTLQKRDEFFKNEIKNGAIAHSVSRSFKVGKKFTHEENVPGGLRDNGEDKSDTIEWTRSSESEDAIDFELSYSIGAQKSTIKEKKQFKVSEIKRNTIVDRLFYSKQIKDIIQGKLSSEQKKQKLEKLLETLPSELDHNLQEIQEQITLFIGKFTPKSDDSVPGPEALLEETSQLSFSSTSIFQTLQQMDMGRTKGLYTMLAFHIPSFDKKEGTVTLTDGLPGTYKIIKSNVDMVDVISKKTPAIYIDGGVTTRPAIILTSTFYDRLKDISNVKSIIKNKQAADSLFLTSIAEHVYENFKDSKTDFFTTDVPEDAEIKLTRAKLTTHGTESEALTKAKTLQLTEEQRLSTISVLQKQKPFNPYKFEDFIDKKSFKCPQHAVMVASIIAHHVINGNILPNTENKNLGKAFVVRGTAYNNKAHAWAMFTKGRHCYLIDSTLPGKKCFELTKENDAAEILRIYKDRDLDGVLEEVFDNYKLKGHPKSCTIPEEELALVPEEVDFEEMKLDPEEIKNDPELETLPVICPISCQVMTDPVLFEMQPLPKGDGKVRKFYFQKGAIEDWLLKKYTNPMTGDEKLPDKIELKPAPKVVKKIRILKRKVIRVEPEEVVSLKLTPILSIRRPTIFNEFYQALPISDEKGRKLGTDLHQQIRDYLRKLKKDKKYTRSAHEACKFLLKELMLKPNTPLKSDLETIKTKLKTIHNFKFDSFPDGIKDSVGKFLDYFSKKTFNNSTTSSSADKVREIFEKLTKEKQNEEAIKDPQSTSDRTPEKKSDKLEISSPEPKETEKTDGTDKTEKISETSDTLTKTETSSPTNATKPPEKPKDSSPETTASSNPNGLSQPPDIAPKPSETLMEISDDKKISSENTKKGPIQAFKQEYLNDYKKTWPRPSRNISDEDLNDPEKVFPHAVQPTFFRYKNRTRKALEKNDTLKSLVTLKATTNGPEMNAEEWLKTFNSKHKAKYGNTWCETLFKRTQLEKEKNRNVTKVLLHGGSADNRTREVLVEMGMMDKQGKLTFKKL